MYRVAPASTQPGIITTLMVTPQPATRLCSWPTVQSWVMNNGKVEQYATRQEIYDKPATPLVAEFVGQGNWLPFLRNSATSRPGWWREHASGG